MWDEAIFAPADSAPKAVFGSRFETVHQGGKARVATWRPLHFHSTFCCRKKRKHGVGWLVICHDRDDDDDDDHHHHHHDHYSY